MMGLIPHYKTFEIKLIPIAINNKVEKNGCQLLQKWVSGWVTKISQLMG